MIFVDNKNNCMVCGNELQYSEKSVGMTCTFCKVNFESNTVCSDGHFVCDSCHSKSAVDLINDFCKMTDSQNPIEMAQTLMKHKRVMMHGPEHHFLVPAVLLASYYNAIGKPEQIASKLAEAAKRSHHVKGGFCGFHGACGAGVGTGIFYSLITNTTPLSTDTWENCNLMTSKALHRIAKLGGPRCCKRDTFTGIREAVKYLKETHQVELESPKKIKCSFTDLNKECTKEKCPYFDKV